MSNNNSILPFGVATAREQQETIGITRVEGDSWNQTMGGLILQGGKVIQLGTDGSIRINFSPIYPKKVLGIFTQAIYPVNTFPAGENEGLVDLVDLEGFTLGNDTTQKDFYWWAIGF